MNGLHFDSRQDLNDLFRFGLSAAAPNLTLERVGRIPASGDYDVCLFRVPSTANELIALVAQLNWVAKPGAALFAYSDGELSDELRQVLTFLGCRGGGNLENASEVRLLWAKIAVYASHNETPQEACHVWSTGSSSDGLPTTWRSVTRSTPAVL